MDSQGLKELHKEKRQRHGIIPFDKTEQAALDIVAAGFKVLLKKHPMREHVLRLGHDWALARLKGKVLVASRPQTSMENSMGFEKRGAKPAIDVQSGVVAP